MGACFRGDIVYNDSFTVQGDIRIGGISLHAAEAGDLVD
jgi:hypothetical protein